MSEEFRACGGIPALSERKSELLHKSRGKKFEHISQKNTKYGKSRITKITEIKMKYTYYSLDLQTKF